MADRSRIQNVTFSMSEHGQYLLVSLDDGRAIGVPLSLYPLLDRATGAQRASWRLIGDGNGIHWDALDLDLSLDGILAGRPDFTRKSLQSLNQSQRMQILLQILRQAEPPMTITQLASRFAQLVPAKKFESLSKAVQKARQRNHAKTMRKAS